MSHETDTPSTSTDIGAFCRAVEAHLCRVNGGHLVRIVGPAFELVAGWAREGMPLRVALHGVDRTVARLTAKGPRRRPIRIEFCEADVRDAAEQWRRAVGVRAAANASPAGSTTEEAAEPSSARLPSLPKHLERVLLRLSALARRASCHRHWRPRLRRRFATSMCVSTRRAAPDARRGRRCSNDSS